METFALVAKKRAGMIGSSMECLRQGMPTKLSTKATGSLDLKHHMLGSLSAKVAAQAPSSVAEVRVSE